jgi:hypothetical protein
MVGVRDSEVAVRIADMTRVPGRMHGAPWEAGPFVRGLRQCVPWWSLLTRTFV